MKQKIFKFEFECCTDWVHAPSLRVSRKFYKNLTQMNDDDLSYAEISPLPKSKWKDYKVVDSAFDEDGSAIAQTFEEWMKDNHDECGIVATTNY